MLTLGKKVDDPKAWNDKQAKWRSDAIVKGTSVGCTSTWACEGCGHLVIDSICLCSRTFTCPGCGYEERPAWIRRAEEMGKNMKVEMPSINGGGGIKLPKYTEYNVHVFNVYRFSDVIKFLELIDKEEGRLQTVVPSFYPNGLSSCKNR